MLRRFVESRGVLSFAVAAAVWLAAWRLVPFPEDDSMLGLIRHERASVYHAIWFSYVAMCFMTPWILVSLALSGAYVFVCRRDSRIKSGRLPPYANPAQSRTLSVVIGEVHHPKKPVPSPKPRWLIVPERGLYTGIAIFGAIGSGKTSCYMYTFASHILAGRDGGRWHICLLYHRGTVSRGDESRSHAVDCRERRASRRNVLYPPEAPPHYDTPASTSPRSTSWSTNSAGSAERSAWTGWPTGSSYLAWPPWASTWCAGTYLPPRLLDIGSDSLWRSPSSTGSITVGFASSTKCAAKSRASCTISWLIGTDNCVHGHRRPAGKAGETLRPMRRSERRPLPAGNNQPMRLDSWPAKELVGMPFSFRGANLTGKVGSFTATKGGGLDRRSHLPLSPTMNRPDRCGPWPQSLDNSVVSRHVRSKLPAQPREPHET